MNVIEQALGQGKTSLSEFESKQLLASYGIPVTREVPVTDEASLIAAADTIGYPLVLKGCAPALTHKTEADAVRLDIRSAGEAKNAFRDIRDRMAGTGATVLVQEMVSGRRELVVGMNRDPQFGPCVMFGLGGIFTEILEDVAFRVAPLERRDALEMMREIKGRRILDAVRGMPAADTAMLAEVLVRVGSIGLEHDSVREIDINPLIISGSKPVAVDALVVLEP